MASTGDGEGAAGAVRASVESSWNVTQGSLESCVDVIFVDPATQEPLLRSPRLSSTTLLLSRPPDSSIPCEITVKFEARLCHVQSFFTLSTARVCELYSCLGLELDPEYVCTVRGWVPYTEIATSGDSSPSKLSPGCEENKDADVDGVAEGRPTPTCLTAQSIFGDENGTLEGALIENTEESGVVLAKVDAGDEVPVKSEDDELLRSVYSSGEESWIEVNSSSSLTGNFSVENLAIPNYCNENLNENHHVQSAGDNWMASSESVIEPNLEKVSEVCHGIGQMKLYEAEVELHHHDPCVAVKVRFLSLEDKTCVKINQMAFLVASGPPILSVQSANQFTQAGGGTSSLLTMLIPSMLQMVRGVHDGRTKAPSGGRLLICNGEGNKGNELEGLPQPTENKRDVSTAAEQVKADGNKADNGASFVSPCYTSNRAANMTSAAVGEDTQALNQPVDFSTFLDRLLVRFDRLEGLCMRMESHIEKAVESLDRRLTSLEREHSKTHAESMVNCTKGELPSLLSTPLPHSIYEGNQVSCPTLEHFDKQIELISMDFKDIPINSKEVCLDDEACEDIQIKELEETTAFEALASHSSTPLKEEVEKKPQISLDDAWASALSAFSCSSMPSSSQVPTDKCGCVPEESNLSPCTSNISTPVVSDEVDSMLSRNINPLPEHLEACIDADDTMELPWYLYHTSVSSVESISSPTSDAAKSSELLAHVVCKDDSVDPGDVMHGGYAQRVQGKEPVERQPFEDLFIDCECSESSSMSSGSTLLTEGNNYQCFLDNGDVQACKQMTGRRCGLFSPSLHNFGEGTPEELTTLDLLGRFSTLMEAKVYQAGKEASGFDAYSWHFGELQFDSDSLDLPNVIMKTEKLCREDTSLVSGTGLTYCWNEGSVSNPICNEDLMSFSEEFDRFGEDTPSALEGLAGDVKHGWQDTGLVELKAMQVEQPFGCTIFPGFEDLC